MSNRPLARGPCLLVDLIILWSSTGHGTSRFESAAGRYSRDDGHLADDTFTKRVFSKHIEVCNLNVSTTCASQNRSLLKYRCSASCSPCYCDHLCTLYGDCCPDVALRKKLSNTRQFACARQVILGEEQMGNLEKFPLYSVIRTCPDDFPDTNLSSRCTDIDFFNEFDLTVRTPLNDDSTNVTYQNVYCALCNRLDASKLTPWFPNIDCVDFLQLPDLSENSIETAINDYLCIVHFSPKPGSVSRECFRKGDTIDTCNQTGLWKNYDPFLDRACRAYRHVFIQNYGNLFCFLCNELSYPMCGLGRNIIFKGLSFSTVLSFNPNRAGFRSKTASEKPFENRTSKNLTCDPGFLLDPFKKICRELLCPMRMIRDGSTCRRLVVNLLQGVAYRLSLSLVPTTARDPFYTYQPVEQLKELGELLLFKLTAVAKQIVFQQYIFLIQGNLTYTQHENSEKPKAYFQSEMGFLLLVMKIKRLHENADEVEMLSDLFRPLTFDSGKYRFRFNIYIDSTKEALVGDILKNKNTMNALFLKTLTGDKIFIPLHSSNQKQYFESPGSLKLSLLTFCDQIEITKNETSIVERGYSIYLPEISATFESHEYELVTPGIYKLCADKYLNKSREAVGKAVQVDSAALSYVSFFSSCVALAFLATSFVVFCCFPELRSLPGKNNMALVLSLFLGQSFFLFGVGRTSLGWGCRVLGIMLHYFLLCGLFWMNVCSFHMYRTFKGTTLIADQSQQAKTYRNYVLYVLLISAAIVILCMLVFYFTTGGATNGYGGHICYLSSSLAIGAFFATPAGLAIAANLVFFGLTINVFRTMPKLDGQASRDRENVYIYVKLSTLTGFHWIVGFLSEVLDSLVLEYGFVVFNGLQGLFIFLSFVCTRRVVTLAKTKCCGAQPGDVPAKTVSTSVPSLPTSSL